MKTSELTGAALNWAVAKCEGMANLRQNPHRFDTRLIMDGPEGNGVFLEALAYSTDWSQGGPIIERENIHLIKQVAWLASINREKLIGWRLLQYGPTPLVAAMRCYCCAKLGEEVDIPKELLT